MTATYPRIPFADQGDKNPVPDTPPTDNSLSYQTGYTQPYEFPRSDISVLYLDRGRFNQVLNRIDCNIQQYWQTGTPPPITPEANGGTAYGYVIGSRVIVNNRIYENTTANNTTTPPGAGWVAVDVDGLDARYEAQAVTHATLSAAMADNNADRQFIRVGDRGGAQYRRASGQTEYTNTPALLRFTDAGNILWVIDVNFGEVNILWAGAVSDSTTDSAPALQACIDYAAMMTRGRVYIPAARAAQSYQLNSTITVSEASVQIVGDGPTASLLIWTLAADNYCFNFDFETSDVAENFLIEGIGIRSNGVPDGIRINNASYFVIRNVLLRDVRHGITVQGTRTFSHTVELLNCFSLSGNAIRFIGFNGGGHFVYDKCTILGNIGVNVDNASLISQMLFTGCNFEQCGNAVFVGGTVDALAITGCRTEATTGTIFQINPAASRTVNGLNISGNFLHTNGTAIRPIDITGDVNGILISANESNITSLEMVNFRGGGASGLVVGNFQNNTASQIALMQPVDREGIFMFANRGTSGQLPNNLPFTSPVQRLAGTVTGATPDVSNFQDVIVNNTSATSMTDMMTDVVGHTVILLFLTGNTTVVDVVSGGQFFLNPRENVTVSASGVMTFKRFQTQSGWFEVSRSF